MAVEAVVAEAAVAVATMDVAAGDAIAIATAPETITAVTATAARVSPGSTIRAATRP